MALVVTCQEVGFENCSFEAAGTEAQIVGQMLAHVRQDHGINLWENVRVQPESSIPEPERMIWARIKIAAAA